VRSVSTILFIKVTATAQRFEFPISVNMLPLPSNKNNILVFCPGYPFFTWAMADKLQTKPASRRNFFMIRLFLLAMKQQLSPF
jgi:hypothetical protein